MKERLFQRVPPQARRYAVALVALLVAGALTSFIVYFNLPRAIVGYAFLLVIIGSAWWGGYGPGLITTFATLLLGPYLVQPTYSIRHPNWQNVPMIVLISVLISRMAAAKQKLSHVNEMLDERVRERTAELEEANGSLQDREAQLIAQAESLSQSNADLEQFAYCASHDLQEPLRMIAIYTELLTQEKESQSPEETTMYARVVRESVFRMEALVKDLLTYSRVIHGDQGERNEIDSRDSLLVAIANLKTRIDAQQADVIVKDLPMVFADTIHLIQIFQNLIGNALKYRSAHAPRIVVEAKRSKDAWIFSVEDNGIGIDPRFHADIFIPFKRLHGDGYPGSGVGLAICKRVVARLGGEIWVESKAGKGATFFFTVPASAPEDSRTVSNGNQTGRNADNSSVLGSD
jgi:signal transduction histidine kinase